MGRWEEGARERLAEAALDLFAERGYDAVTAADIAERAGLTRSTFFRHFADKREVLFDGQEQMSAAIAAGVASAEGMPVLDVMGAALTALAPFFPANIRSRSAIRAAVIADHRDLRERSQLKRAALVESFEQAFSDHGIDGCSARLGADFAALVLDASYAQWVAGEQPFTNAVASCLADFTKAASAMFEPRTSDTQHHPHQP